MPADKVAYWQECFEQVFTTGRQQTVDFEFDSPTFGHQCFSSLFVPEFDACGREDAQRGRRALYAQNGSRRRAARRYSGPMMRQRTGPSKPEGSRGISFW